MTKLHRAASLAALLTAAACATTAPSPEQTAERFRTHVETLADDSFEGREAGTPGYQKAVAYVTDAFAAMGVAPAGTDGYLQPVPLRRARVAYDQDTSMTFTAPGGGQATMEPFRDFLVRAPRSSDPAAMSARAMVADAPLAFVGDGIDAPSLGVDSYGDIDLRGKVAVMRMGAPEGLPSEEAAHLSGVDPRIAAAVARGAVGVLFLVPAPSDDASVARRRGWAERASDTFAGASPEQEGVPVAYVFADAGRVMLSAGTRSFDEVMTSDEAFDLEGTVDLQAVSSFENYSSPNVAGLIEGTDPALKNEVVVLSAHLDHVGVHGEGEDRIHNGAMDNATGIATLLEVARMFEAEGAPRRSVLLLAVTAEEKGLLGSDYFARYPSLPGKRMVANVNLDMPILTYDFQDVIAFGAKHSDLGEKVGAATDAMGIALTPDPYPEQVLFVRSDHYSFVKQGVPSVFLFLGTENGGAEAFQAFMATHYHQPSDEPDLPIAYDAAARFAALNYEIAKAVANADEAPSWKPDSYFGTLAATGGDRPGS